MCSMNGYIVIHFTLKKKGNDMGWDHHFHPNKKVDMIISESDWGIQQKCVNQNHDVPG